MVENVFFLIGGVCLGVLFMIWYKSNIILDLEEEIQTLKNELAEVT